ncbi:MAG: hypothetical protein N2444_08460 [Methylocystis sp.]|nr:hypothetical protein [Methylocystis sp.]
MPIQSLIGVQRSSVILTLSAALLAAPDAAPAKPARAAIAPQQNGGFDGVWVIDATTTNFFCPLRRKRLMAEVHGGRVTKLTGLPGSVTGHINPDGSVLISARIFGRTAHITGSVNGSAGAGDWSADSMICPKGQWTARFGN